MPPWPVPTSLRTVNIASVIRQGQHVGEKRGVFTRSRALSKQSVKLVELRPRVVLARMSGRAFHVADNWIERAIRVLRRAEVSHACMRLARQPLQERRRQSRLAYARLSREQHDLAFARCRVGPAQLQQVAFFLPPDQGGQTISV